MAIYSRLLRWVLCLLPIIVLGFAFYISRQMPSRLKHMYAEWATIELIMTTHHLSGRLPASWEDLAPWYEQSNTTPRSGISFPQLRELVEIDFSQLPNIEAAARSGRPLPESRSLIRKKDGRGGHWISPNQMLADYFKTGTVVIIDKPWPSSP